MMRGRRCAETRDAVAQLAAFGAHAGSAAYLASLKQASGAWQGLEVELAVVGHRGPGLVRGASTPSRTTSRWPDSAARRCDRSRPASARAKGKRYIDIHEGDQL